MKKIKNITREVEKGKIVVTPVGAPFIVIRCCPPQNSVYAPPPSVTDLILGTVEEKGLEDRCTAYAISTVAKDVIFCRDPESPQHEKFVVAAGFRYETYAVQLYKRKG